MWWYGQLQEVQAHKGWLRGLVPGRLELAYLCGGQAPLTLAWSGIAGLIPLSTCGDAAQRV
jgi:hypothetical protein